MTEEEEIKSGVESFINSTDEEKLQQPEFFFKSTLNFVSIVEKLVYEKAVDKETALVHKLVESFQEPEKQQETKTATKTEEIEKPKDTIQTDSSNPNSSFYRTRIEKQEAAVLEHGTFFLDKGKLYHGAAEQREMATYSNWYAGNVDPEEMRRHKELLDRQHFSGRLPLI